MLRILIIIISIISISCTKINENISPIINSYHVLGREEIKENNKVIVFSNETLLIVGVNLINYNSVYINGLKCEVITNQSNSELITIKAPKNAITGKIRVNTSPAAVFSNEDVIVKKNAIIESFTPTQVITGDRVVVKGEGFLGLLTIKIGEVKVSNVNVINDNEVNFIAPNFERNSNITFETKSGVFHSSKAIEILSPPTVEIIRPLVWKKDVIAVVNGSNINTTTSVKLNNVPLVINEKDTDLRIKVSLNPNLNYTSGNLVFENAAGSFTSRDMIQIIKDEVLADFSNLSGTYFSFISNYSLQSSNQNDGYFNTVVLIKDVTEFSSIPKKLLEINTTVIPTVSNKMSKWSIKLANNIPLSTVMFHEMKGTTIDNYTLKNFMYNNNNFDILIKIVLLIKDSETSNILEYSSSPSPLSSQTGVEQQILTYNFSTLVPVDNTNKKTINSFRMSAIRGIVILMTPPENITGNFLCYMEKITMTGPVYD